MCDNNYPCPRYVKRQLRQAKLPRRLRREVCYGPAQRGIRPGTIQWPPDPGSTYPPLGTVRIWGAFDPAAWFRLAPKAFGPPHTADEIAELCELAAQLRENHPSGTALWAIDVLHPHMHWTDHPRIALGISVLVYYGPKLPEELVAQHTARLSDLGWRLDDGLPEEHPFNTPRTDGKGLPCYVTHWNHGT